MDSLQRAQRSTTISYFMITQTKTKNRHKQGTRRMRLKRNQILRGHKEGRASFPIQSPYKVSRIHTPNPTPREEEQRGGGEGRQGEMVAAVLVGARRAGERRGVRGI